MNRASIAIFGQKEVDYSSEHESRPIVPDEVFEAAQRVIENKNMELVKTRSGMYIVVYSQNGPFQHGELVNEWLPVYIARIKKWDSGGITRDEMASFEKEKT
jgi:hypothetical protein